MMRTVAAVVLLTLCGSAGAQVSKCIDAKGKVVGYGTQCPAGTQAQETTIRNAPAAAAPAAKSLAERDAEFRKRQMERQESAAKAEKASAENDQRKRACTQAQSYLKALQGGQRIRTTDAKSGERSYLSDAEYPKEIARAEKSVASTCK